MAAGNRIPGFARMSALAWLVFAVLTIAPMAGSAAQQKEMPLTDAEVMDLLQNQVPVQRIIELVRQNGAAFAMTGEIEQRLRKAGATKELIDTLTKQYKAPAAHAQQTSGNLSVKTKPGGAQIYLDDEFKGETSPQGDLRIPGVPVGDHKLRADLSGYQTWEDSVTVPAGETMTAFVNLVPKTAAPSVSPQVNPAVPLPETSMPIAGGRVISFRFFETPRDFPPANQRHYSQVFTRDSSQYIAWELRLSYTKLDAPLSLQLVALWRDAAGKIIHTQTHRAFLQAGWDRSIHAMGWGPGCAKIPCQPWPAGTYSVELLARGSRIAEGSFEMR
jgi:PEGA domain